MFRDMEQANSPERIARDYVIQSLKWRITLERDLQTKRALRRLLRVVREIEIPESADEDLAENQTVLPFAAEEPAGLREEVAP